MNRRLFLTTTAAASFALAQHRSFAFEEATVTELQEEMERGRSSSEHIARLHIERIETLDKRGPALHSVLEINPDALAIARSLDIERKHKGPRGPLHGIPVLLKDNIDTRDRLHTTAGSLALLDAPTPQDAFIAERLRTAGAVILGKTNLSEWANFRSSRSVSGWSARGGQTRNPYALDRNPCGSSSGSGVAVSANLTVMAVGTETDGSIVCPSTMNGIVGIKPTLGLVSRAGIIPIAHSQDTAGPMARTVRDAAILLGVLAGVDPRDPATAAASGKIASDYTQFCKKDGLRGARLGVARQYFTLGPKVDALMHECLGLMIRLGAQLVDPVEFAEFEGWRETETTALLYEFKADLGKYLEARGGPHKSLADIMAFNDAHIREEMPYFGQELMEQAQQKGGLGAKEYTDALAKNAKLARKDGIDAILKKNKIDAIVAPTSGPAFFTDLVNGDRIDSGCASPPAVAGYPHISVPAGHIFGLPVGLSFFSTAWMEPKLIQYAYAFEQARNARQRPRFLPTADLET